MQLAAMDQVSTKPLDVHAVLTKTVSHAMKLLIVIGAIILDSAQLMAQIQQIQVASLTMLKHVLIIVKLMEDLDVLHAITSMDVDGVQPTTLVLM